jgi:gamma-glutamylcysteine synthetase
MMGSRGAVNLPPEAAGLAMLADLVSLLKNCEKILPAAVAELRVAEADANKARAALDALIALHNAAQAELDNHAQQLTLREDGLAKREAAAKAREDETKQLQFRLDGQAKALQQTKTALNER